MSAYTLSLTHTHNFNSTTTSTEYITNSVPASNKLCTTGEIKLRQKISSVDFVTPYEPASHLSLPLLSSMIWHLRCFFTTTTTTTATDTHKTRIFFLFLYHKKR
eukprot:GHVS01072202.1.p1 GENE.GHVS01072202.1~~GHVS01072202.1.p1  ORF type:complete len:104 (-),score=18.43 GHVS01072202.1:94-405(-)